MKRILIAVVIILTFTAELFAQQKLKPGFDPIEFKSLLEITSRQIDTPWTNVTLPYPEGYKLEYRSPVVGLDNRWDLWLGNDNIAVISIRATTATMVSWLADFYAGMIPAAGELIIDSATTFKYKLADIPNSYVHVGWVVGLSAIAPLIVKKINEYYGKGIKDLLIIGHSQGAAIAYLLRSYLYYCESIPKDIAIKTYCCATPKPGNQFYSYDYDFITSGGWGLRVINTEDWVPETPFSIETVNDLPQVNPFNNINDAFAQIKKPIVRMVLKSVYRKLFNSTDRAQKTYTRILGKKAYKIVRRTLPQFKEPVYVKSMDYTTAGQSVILKATPEYFEQYIDKLKRKHDFIHHMPGAYLFLLNQHYLSKK
jgi:hypothetical protein